MFHPVVVQTIRKKKTYVHPSRLSTIEPVSKQELLLEIVFLGTEPEHDTYKDSSAYHAAWNGGFAGARKESTLRQTDDISAPLLIFPSGFPLELFDSVRHCLQHPRRHNSFEGPSVRVIHNILPNLLAEDVLAVLSRSTANQAALAGIRQAVVLPPVSNATKLLGFRLVILWLEPQHVDLTSLTQAWGKTMPAITITREFLAGYYDLMKLKDMYNMHDSEEPIPTSTPMSYYGPSARGGRGGRGGRTQHTTDQLNSPSTSTLTTASIPVTTASSADWTTITKQGTFDIEHFISDMMDKKITTVMADVTHRIDRLTEGMAQADQDRARADFDRMVNSYSLRVSMWITRSNVHPKTKQDNEKLEAERVILQSLRRELLQMPGANPLHVMDF